MTDRDQFKTLRALSADLERADAAQALLDEIWAWCRPYGPTHLSGYYPTEKARKFLASPDGQRLLEALNMPDELRHKLQKHYKFDDSE